MDGERVWPGDLPGDHGLSLSNEAARDANQVSAGHYRLRRQKKRVHGVPGNGFLCPAILLSNSVNFAQPGFVECGHHCLGCWRVWRGRRPWLRLLACSVLHANASARGALRREHLDIMSVTTYQWDSIVYTVIVKRVTGAFSRPSQRVVATS